MKNENVMKINNLGKISRILLTIIMIVIMVCIVCVPIIMVIFCALPDYGLKINGDMSVNIMVDDDSIPDKLFEVDESDFNSRILGVALKWIVKDEGVVDGDHLYTISGGVKDLTGKQVKLVIATACIAAEVVLVCLYVAVVFARKLAKALENCNSPFEEAVLNRMKSFGIALAVWAAAVLLINGISGIIVAFAVIIVLLFISIFKYGAQLQQQADDTV